VNSGLLDEWFVPCCYNPDSETSYTLLQLLTPCVASEGSTLVFAFNEPFISYCTSSLGFFCT